MGCRETATVKMESSSLKASSGSSDALHGLKFGQKTYFDDSGSRRSGSSSKPPPVPPPPQKKGKGVAQGRQQQHTPPPRCQVEGCNVDLTGVKAYYCRHKVCGMHSKAPKVVVAGLEQRFCQQCSRFHQLAEFDQGKRSCRRRLAGHNERRRKPPPGTFASRYGQFAPRYHEQPRHRSFLMDFSYPNLFTAARDRWPTARAGHRTAASDWHEPLDASPGSAVMHGTHPCFHGPLMELPPGEFSLAGVSNSSCALSLLSTHPWSSNSSSGHAPTVPASSTSEGSSFTNQIVAVGDYIASSWAIGGHEGRTRAHEIQHEMGLVGSAEEAGGARFTAQVEFAHMENGHSCPGMHWSL